MNVSVAIPAKNEEGNIGRCLDRLTSQLDPGDEILVLDNGSSDRTAGIAASYEQVTVLDAPDERFDDAHYRGLSQLRQLGAETARNEIIATTDADTLPPSEWLDRIKAHFEDDDDLSVLWGVATDTNGVPVRDMTGKYLTFLGGVSGCNTAFRKSHFKKLAKGYTGWPMFEDVALVTRLARTGKAKHDTGMEMRTDLDRRRYQTYPMVASSGAAIGAGALIGGPVGALAAGAGAGVGGTELFYENAPSTPFHHDQIGFGLILAGLVVGGTPGVASAGLGAGMFTHHLLTEGASAIPTDLMAYTDEFCYIEDDGQQATITCETATDSESKLTRILAAAAVGGVIGSGVQAVTGQ